MRHIVVGTAGHIDHGKSALVRALTGIETDRLEEEKRRGISIDIGFAHLELSSELRLAFVDVPGHERFIKNMLAGVGGIDLVLLVVAADSSVCRQTLEHFDICRLLGVRRGLVAITKTDLVESDIVDLVRLEVEELVRGSFLEGAPIVRVSSTTGAGLDRIRDSLARLAAEAPPRNPAGHFRLPIDRSFAMRGFGTVVTGTMISGSVRLEDEVEVHPSGMRLRVRGIQIHGGPGPQAVAGQRAALNLSGADYPDLSRGMQLTHPNLFEDTRLLDCAFDLLSSAKPLKHRAPVHFHAGTAEIEAEIRRVDGSTSPIEPGSRSYVRLVLREPAMLLPADRFILRMFSPVVTIGGGIVLDSAPPRRTTVERLRALENAGPAERIELFLKEAPFGLSLAALVARTGLTEADLRSSAREFTTGHYLHPDRAAELARTWRDELAAFHKRNPLLPGIPREQLRGSTPPVVFDALIARDTAVVVESDTIRLKTHKLAFREDESLALGKIESAFERAGLHVPSVAEVLASSGVELARARSLLQVLLREKKLTRVTDDLIFHPSALQSLRTMLGARKGQTFTVSDFKDWTGVSRKYAIPLLEMLDRERTTRRTGDTRLIL
jgi:selenocysteine-specific elongation factor